MTKKVRKLTVEAQKYVRDLIISDKRKKQYSKRELMEIATTAYIVGWASHRDS